MKIKILLAVVAALGCWAGCAARTAAELFSSAPDNIIRLLPQSTRLDMLDYFNYGSTRASANAFGGEARVTALSDATVSLDLDKNVSMQIAVMPAGNDTVVALVTTLRMPVADSSIDFYDTSWRPLRKAPMTMPAYNDWLTPEGRANAQDVELALPFMPVSAMFDNDATVLRLSNEAGTYLSDESLKEMDGRLVETIVYNVRSGKFVRQ